MNLPSQEICTGCQACFNVCPRKAISMNPDVEGFLQPSVNDAICIKCGLCEKVCPLLHLDKCFPINIHKRFLCGVSKSYEIWKQSSSGGMFSEICYSQSEKAPIIFGARFDGVDYVRHDYSEGVEGINIFRKSKYIQSDIRSSMKECKHFLDTGRLVIFSGTPCQIAGLNCFLAKDYKNLITVEFICHGVGSRKVFSDCLSIIENKKHKHLLRYTFRSKENLSKAGGYISFWEFEDGKSYNEEVDLYNQFFLNNLCLRKACSGNCKFRNEKRCADITLADSREEKTIYKNKDSKNWSIIVANTEKGASIVTEVEKRAELYSYPRELLLTNNPYYFVDKPFNAQRQFFFNSYINNGQDILPRLAKEMQLREKLWLKPSLWTRVIRRLKKILHYA